MPERGIINRMKRIAKVVLALALVIAALLGSMTEAAGRTGIPGRTAGTPGWTQGGPETDAQAGLLAKSRKKKNTPTPKPAKTPKPQASPTPEAAGPEKDAAPAPTPVPAGPIIEPQAIADYLFSHNMTLPDNFITKKEARALGWGSTYRTVAEAAPGKSIGGDYFANYQRLLPVKKGVSYHEADCWYTGGSRNGYRVVFSTDGRVWYTEDHYESFVELFPGGGK